MKSSKDLVRKCHLINIYIYDDQIYIFKHIIKFSYKYTSDWYIIFFYQILTKIFNKIPYLIFNYNLRKNCLKKLGIKLGISKNIRMIIYKLS